MQIMHAHERVYRVGHIACGIGAGAKGFNDAQPRVGMIKARFECAGGIDVDPGAIRNFNAITGSAGTVADLFSRDQYVRFHGKQPPVGWAEMGPEDLRRAFGGYGLPLDVVFCSLPCLPGHELVITETGTRPISTIKAGDRVLSHNGRYCNVAKVNRRPYQDQMHTIRLAGTPFGREYTSEHPIYVRTIAKTGKEMGEPSFRPAREVSKGDRVGFPLPVERIGTAKEMLIPTLDALTTQVKGSGKSIRYGKPSHTRPAHQTHSLERYFENPALWRLIGAYLGDGYSDARKGKYRVTFCPGPEDGQAATQIKNDMESLGMKPGYDRGSGQGNVKIFVTNKHMHRIVSLFGRGASNKAYPEATFALETELLEALIEGHRMTDGSDRIVAGKLRWKIVSTSQQLMLDVQRALLRFQKIGSIHVAAKAGTAIIEGRAVTTKDRWEIVVIEGKMSRRQLMIFEGGHVWTRVSENTSRNSSTFVWNLEVDEDDTYCSPMIATHNCKGLSSLLSDDKYRSPKYQALNELSERAIWMTLEAYKDDPVKVILFENVPRISNRGRPMLDRIQQLLAAYGYAFAETVHDCGEIGGLAQHRKRFLMVARHIASIPNFLYEPEKKQLRGVGEIIGKLPLPGDPVAGPMHRVPKLQWKTWVRLAFVEAGKDWRSLQNLRVRDGVLEDYAIVPEGNRRENNLGVLNWDDTANTMTTQRSPLQGRFSVADPRAPDANWNRGVLGVNDWQGPTGVVPGASRPGNGNHSVADPRVDKPVFNSIYRIVPYDGPSPAITGPGGAAGGVCVADPRGKDAQNQAGAYHVRNVANDENDMVVNARSGTDDELALQIADPNPGYGPNTHHNVMRVQGLDQPAGTITGSNHPAGGCGNVADPRYAVTDPRPTHGPNAHSNKLKVVASSAPAPTLTTSDRVGSGALCVASDRLDHGYDVVGDQLPDTLPAPDDRLVARIIALDGTWHRPFTTLEAAALQSLFDPDIFAKGGKFDLESTSDAEKREWIGNAVPSDAARGMAETIGRTLILAETGQTFTLSADAIWCNPLELALAVNPMQRVAGEMLYG